jgi:hypothetical protein
MARLGILLGHSEPIITVIGKYNHGKSHLLNELIGQETFVVADKRETVRLLDRVHNGVRWLDAPGLDADVGTDDARERMASLEAFRVLQLEQRRAFDQGLANVIARVGLDIEVMLDGLGEDYASIPDTARDAYASTAGKRERDHLQIAYSRACIEIDGFLVRYGVIGLSLLHLRRWASRFPLVFQFPASRGRLSSCW